MLFLRSVKSFCVHILGNEVLTKEGQVLANFEWISFINDAFAKMHRAKQNYTDQEF